MCTVVSALLVMLEALIQLTARCTFSSRQITGNGQFLQPVYMNQAWTQNITWF